jgi:type IV secretory pathway TraG/TraD family ATPase VirD4
MPLIRLNQQDHLTLQDVFTGVHIFGGVGSGKTTSSGATLAETFLRAGFGGLVLTAKPGEAQSWVRRAKRCNRGKHVLLFGPDHPARFNFLNYCMGRPGPGGGLVQNLINLFEEILEVYSPDKSLGGDPYWRQGRTELLSNTIELIWLAKGKLSFEDIIDVVDSAPRSASDIYDPSWMIHSEWAHMVDMAADRVAKVRPERDAHVLEAIYKFWTKRFAPQDPEPRSSVISMVSALTDPLSRGVLHELFLTKTTMVPDLATEGTIIILDMPVLQYEKVGRFAQALFKGVFQRMAERRVQTDDTARPMFLWADEAHLVMTSRDANFLSVSRESRVANVFLSQNLPNYYVAMGGDGGAHDRTKQLLGAFGLKIFHANGDPETNRYSEDLGGKGTVIREGESVTRGVSAGPGGMTSSKSVTRSWNEAFDVLLPARWFTLLRRGGPKRGYSEAFIVQTGEPWKTNQSNALRVRFSQEYH